ncbi:glycogen debranching enzyme N-terminal domain-containing protein [Micromonospora sp. M12]
MGLASLDPAVTLPSGARVRLGAHEWASGDVDPRGFELLERFDLVDGLPRWRWRIGGVVIEREVAMLPGRSCVAVVHRLVAGGPVRLELSAACTWRDAHGERRADGPVPQVEPVADGAVVEGAYRLAGPGWSPEGQWWLGVHHREEANRGLNADEDLWYAGRFVGELDRPGDTVAVRAWAGRLDEEPPASRRSWQRRGSATGGWWRRRSRRTRSRRRSRWPPTRSWCVPTRRRSTWSPGTRGSGRGRGTR